MIKDVYILSQHIYYCKVTAGEMIRMTMKTPKLHLSTSDTISSASVGICRDACGQLRYSESKWRMPRRLHRRREPTVL